MALEHQKADQATFHLHQAGIPVKPEVTTRLCTHKNLCFCETVDCIIGARAFWGPRPSWGKSGLLMSAFISNSMISNSSCPLLHIQLPSYVSLSPMLLSYFLFFFLLFWVGGTNLYSLSSHTFLVAVVKLPKSAPLPPMGLSAPAGWPR